MFTYGIEPCCGLVLYDGNIRVLFHLDGSITPKDVIKVAKSIGLQKNATALIAPGTTCFTPGCFEYEKLEEELKKLGYKIIEERIPGTLGFITVSKDQIIIGTALDKSLNKTFQIERKKLEVTTEQLGREILPELEDTEFLEEIEQYNSKIKKQNSNDKII